MLFLPCLSLSLYPLPLSLSIYIYLSLSLSLSSALLPSPISRSLSLSLPPISFSLSLSLYLCISCSLSLSPSLPPSLSQISPNAVLLVIIPLCLDLVSLVLGGVFEDLPSIIIGNPTLKAVFSKEALNPRCPLHAPPSFLFLRPVLWSCRLSSSLVMVGFGCGRL